MKIFSDNVHSIDLKPETVFLICSIIFGLFFVIATPPFQAPDGKAHYARAFQVSNGNFYHGSFVDQVSFGFNDYWFSKFNKVSKEKTKLSISKLKAYLFSASPNTESKTLTYQTTAYVYHPISYLASGAGIALAQFFNLPSVLYIYMGRMINLMIWILFSWIGLRILPFFKWESMFFMLLPMSLFMGASISADSFNNAVCFLLICSIFSLLHTSNKNLPLWFYILITTCAFAAACGKQIYALLFYLTCFSYDRFKNKRYFWCYIISTSFLIIIGGLWVVFNPTTVNLNSDLAFKQLTQSFLNPFKILAFTLYHYHMAYLKQFIGVLGWLDTHANDSIYKLYALMLILSITVMSTTSHKISRSLRLAVGALVIFYIIFIIFTLYLIWPNSSKFICDGVQGRYFIPFMLLLPFVFAKSLPDKSSRIKSYIASVLESAKKPLRIALFLVTIIGLTSFCFALSSRYYIGNDKIIPQTSFAQNISNWHCNEITKDRTISQEFIAQALNLKEISLFFGTYRRRNTGLLRLEILDHDMGAVVGLVDDSMEYVKDNSWHTFEMNPVRLIPGKKYIIQLTAPKAVNGNAITWYGCKTDVFSNIDARINGRSIPGDFSFFLTYDNPSFCR